MTDLAKRSYAVQIADFRILDRQILLRDQHDPAVKLLTGILDRPHGSLASYIDDDLLIGKNDDASGADQWCPNNCL